MGSREQEAGDGEQGGGEQGACVYTDDIVYACMCAKCMTRSWHVLCRPRRCVAWKLEPRTLSHLICDGLRVLVGESKDCVRSTIPIICELGEDHLS